MADLSKYADEDLFALASADIEGELKKRGYVHGWYKKEEYAGYIYILVNPSFDYLVKIGYADNVQARMKSLNHNSGLPDPFHCYAVYKVRKRLQDQALHSLIDGLDPSIRHSKNREFFEMSKEKAYAILSAIAQINGSEDLLIKDPFHDPFFASAGTTETNSAAPDGEEYHLVRKIKREGRTTDARMRISDGKYVVLAGSAVATEPTKDVPAVVLSKREDRVKDGILTEDIPCDTPSQAGVLVCMNAVNGWKDWKLPDGTPLDAARRKET